MLVFSHIVARTIVQQWDVLIEKGIECLGSHFLYYVVPWDDGSLKKNILISPPSSRITQMKYIDI